MATLASRTVGRLPASHATTSHGPAGYLPILEPHCRSVCHIAVTKLFSVLSIKRQGVIHKLGCRLGLGQHDTSAQDITTLRSNRCPSHERRSAHHRLQNERQPDLCDAALLTPRMAELPQPRTIRHGAHRQYDIHATAQTERRAELACRWLATPCSRRQRQWRGARYL